MTTAYNRPCDVLNVYGDMAEVMFTDTNWTVSHVAKDALEYSGADE